MHSTAPTLPATLPACKPIKTVGTPDILVNDQTARKNIKEKKLIWQGLEVKERYRRFNKDKLLAPVTVGPMGLIQRWHPMTVVLPKT